MSLLERIACSNGDPYKTIDALRLINQRLLQELEHLKAQQRIERGVTNNLVLSKVKKKGVISNGK
ncbi:MAG: hypothetical protein KDI79_25075 [Anaerolineae bacterium]|nr:hypothetical protein [Anaerolineae bacterium]